MPMSIATAAMGGEIDVQTLAGRASLKIAKGTPSGQLLRLKGQGMPSLNGRGGGGDLIVRVVVQVPPKTTKRMEELLAEYQVLEEEQMKNVKKGFWDKIFG